MMGAFFLAMALYPEVQNKAQRQLDTVIGTERLPDFSDRPSLPYITAVVKELLRWHPAGPIGMPHTSSADDEYNGYLIPGGTAVIANLWCVPRSSQAAHSRDPKYHTRSLRQGHSARSRGLPPAGRVCASPFPRLSWEPGCSRTRSRRCRVRLRS